MTLNDKAIVYTVPEGTLCTQMQCLQGEMHGKHQPAIGETLVCSHDRNTLWLYVETGGKLLDNSREVPGSCAFILERWKRSLHYDYYVHSVCQYTLIQTFFAISYRGRNITRVYILYTTTM